jgi:peptidylprolyl isomerase domain and WD repeat-containing protein 1
MTASMDGCVKFWKKTKGGIEFVKTFKSHLGPIIKMDASPDGLLLATISKDTTMKIYDIVNFGKLLKKPFPSLSLFFFYDGLWIFRYD